MIVQHNIMALNAYNRLSSNNASVSKNLEKLSSGYKINRAGDDAAGLAISEKMRAQITGLERASDNAQDGISLVQTAEGALTEVHSMLNRMVDLATQSSNGTFDNETDRANLQSEMNSLKDEINRIAKETNFNGINLLDGSLGSSVASTGATLGTGTVSKEGVDIEAAASVFTSGEVGVGTAAGAVLSITYTDADGVSKNVTASYTGSTDAGDNLDAMIAALTDELGTLFNVEAHADGDKLVITSKTKGADAPVITELTTDDAATATALADGDNDYVVGAGAGKTFELQGGATNVEAGNSISINGKTFAFVDSAGDSAPYGAIAVVAGGDLDESVENLQNAIKAAGMDNITVAANEDGDGINVTSNGQGLGLQIGDTASQRISVKVDNMGTSSLGLDNVDISTEASAVNSIQYLKTAINTVSSTRADLGAIQNRLEHTVNNLATTTENLTSAESRIRDTDMAKEMMAYTKNNVLSQAAQAMLAQANQQPQQVLQLLR